MLLGGLRYLLPVIEEAHKLGAYVITVDYLPDNIAHKYSDEYHNVSILDREVGNRWHHVVCSRSGRDNRRLCSGRDEPAISGQL